MGPARVDICKRAGRVCRPIVQYATVEAYFQSPKGADQQKILRCQTQYASFCRIIYSLATFSRCCRKIPCGDGPQFATLYSAFRDHCLKNKYAVIRANQQKILRYWTKYAFLSIIYSVGLCSAQVAEKPLGDGPKFDSFIAYLSQMKHLIFVCRCVKPFRSYVLPTDVNPRKLIQ